MQSNSASLSFMPAPCIGPVRRRRGAGVRSLALTKRPPFPPPLAPQGRDSVTLLLCALAHGLTWSRTALLLLVLGGYLEAPPRAADLAAFVCQWLITPFAYLYHEAVGVGFVWGASGVASRAAEAAAVLALLAVLLNGSLSLLSTIFPLNFFNATWGGSASTSALLLNVAVGGANTGAPPTLDRFLLLVGLIGTLVSFARGALHPLLPPRRRTEKKRSTSSSEIDVSGWSASAKLALSSPSSLIGIEDADTSRMFAEGASVRSLLSEPLPAQDVIGVIRAAADSLRHLSGWQTLRLTASLAWAVLWASFVLSAIFRLAALMRMIMLAESYEMWPADVAIEPAVVPVSAMSKLSSEFGDAFTDADGVDSWWRLLEKPTSALPERPRPPSGSSQGWWWVLSSMLVLASVIGHHLLCRVQLRDTRPGGAPSRGTPLQSQLLESAALQIQAAAIPVAGHALGIVPADVAASCTPMPLFTSSLGAAMYCAAFITTNLLVVGLLVGRWRRRLQRLDHCPPSILAGYRRSSDVYPALSHKSRWR
mgnify:CR=1 FL=1